jgi:serine/threonine protein kinase
MERSVASGVATCSVCGQSLNSRGECLACLIRAALEESITEDGPNSLVFGDFEVVRRDDGSLFELGHGAMGVTYLAVDNVLRRKVALKIIELPQAARTSHAVRERFLREARAAACLRHPNVAAVFQFGGSPSGRHCYYAMELIEGETLQERVQRDGPLNAKLVLEIAIQTARALTAAAAQGLIHRDLKPGNIMLTRGNADTTEVEVKVIDFGLAKAIADAGSEMDLTGGGFVGTPNFASPEQFESGPIDVRADIYSLGVTLWFALTGKAPFVGRSIEEIRSARKSNALPVEQLEAARVPSRLKSLLKSMLALEPAARPGIQELATSLRRCSAKEIALEIAHVLFIDVVGYSKLSINEQQATVDELTQIVRSGEQFQKADAADGLIKIPSGDGMALVFYTSPEAPVRCAIEISRALKDHPPLQVRMGIHSGPASGVVDVTDRANLTGAGLNIANRVMECGDAGHILLSKHVAEGLTLQADFYHIDLRSVTAILDPQFLIDHEDQFPGQVIRGPSTGPNYPFGPIVLLLLPEQNLGRIIQEGWDYEVAYSFDTSRLGHGNWGTVTAILNGTYIDRVVLQAVVGGPEKSVVGKFGGGFLETASGGLPPPVGGGSFTHNRWYASLFYDGPAHSQLAGLDAGFTVHYIGQYWDLKKSTPGLNRKIREWTTLDWVLNYTFNFTAPTVQNEVAGYSEDGGKNATMKAGKDNNVMPVSTAEYNPRGWRAWLKGTTITLGVNNVFDLAPPFVAGAIENGYDESTANIKGRTWYVALKKRF